MASSDAEPAPAAGHRARLDALFARERQRREAWMAQLPESVRRLLPLDATPTTQGIELLADALGIGERIAARQREASHANSAVLHGRVFGRGAGLSRETALAAFADGARVRAGLLAQLAEAVDGAGLRRDVEALLAEHPDPPAEAADAERAAALEAIFDAQERALQLLADRLDDVLGR